MTTILDQFGRPVDLSALREEEASPTISGVRTSHRDGVASGLTPQRLGRLLKDADEGNADAYLTLAEEMEERWPHYRSVLFTRKLAIRRVPISVQSATDSAKDVAIADAVRAQIAKPQFRMMLLDLADGLGKGYSVIENIWDTAKKPWTVERFEWADPHFFQFDAVTGRELRLRDEADIVNGLPLKPFKFIKFVPKLKSGKAIRGGLARVACAGYMCSSFTLRDWLTFSEVFGMPIRVGRYPTGADPKDIRKLLAAVAGMGADAAAVIPTNMMIDFPGASISAAGGEKVFGGLTQLWKEECSIVVLGQTMTTQDGSSLAQAQVHNLVREDIRGDDVEQALATLQRDYVEPFVILNFGVQEVYPTLQGNTAPPENLKMFADAIVPFIDRGLRVEASVIRDKFGLPEPEEGAECLSAKASAPAPGTEDEPPPEDAPPKPKAKPKKKPNLALVREPNAIEEDSDEIDRLADAAADEWRPLLAPIVDEVIKGTEGAKNYADLDARIRAMHRNGKLDITPIIHKLATDMLKAHGLGDATDDT